MSNGKGFHSSRESYELEDCEIEAETSKAILVSTEEHPDGIWLPLSQIDKITRSLNKRCSKVRMTAWIAKEKGLI